ncbi:MAG: ATP-binding cassette domain-containing protein [Tannerellaceae bacterium]|nr:ATP-binding cassette domain-containing protein [Tannerellaceae bacterium]
MQRYCMLLSIPKKKLKKIRADKLSGGERHQLVLAMCLLKKPKFLILDEPSAGLSPKAVDAMYTTLSVLCKEQGLTILLIEQNVAKAVEFCDSVYLLREGKIEHRFTGKNLKEIEIVMFN